MDILAELRAVQTTGGDTYSSAEVLGMVGRAADEIERLQTKIKAEREKYPYSEEDLDMHVEAVTKELKTEIERLLAALSWIADHDPQIVDAAREKFGID